MPPEKHLRRTPWNRTTSKRQPLLIAVCGKGGVGKTSISALVIKILAEKADKRILAIDADPAVGLATALGFQGERTVNDIRNDLIGRIEKGESENRQALLAALDYEVMAALEERENVAFLAIGRPEKEGCYCKVNSMLRDIIESVARNFDYVVIDGEAGIEQVNRRVLSTVTHLLLVSDASAKGLKVIETIGSVAGQAVHYEKAGLLLNRIRSEEEKNRLSLPPAIPLLGWIPEDDSIREADIAGRNLMEIPHCPAIEAVKSGHYGFYRLKVRRRIVRMDIDKWFSELLDDPCNELVRKSMDEGQIPIGYSCSYVPDVMLSVDGLFPVRMRAPGIAGTELADNYLSSVICSYTRSLLEFALDGRYDFLRAGSLPPAAIISAAFTTISNICDDRAFHAFSMFPTRPVMQPSPGTPRNFNF